MVGGSHSTTRAMCGFIRNLNLPPKVNGSHPSSKDAYRRPFSSLITVTRHGAFARFLTRPPARVRRGGVSVRHEDWQAHARQEVISNAAQQFFPKPGMAEGARDDQIGAERALRLAACRQSSLAEHHRSGHVSRGAMPSEMLDDVLPRKTAMRSEKVRRIDHEDRRPLCPLDQRHGVVDRSGRGPARVPGDRAQTKARPMRRPVTGGTFFPLRQLI
jgi:hypothetical protein